MSPADGLARDVARAVMADPIRFALAADKFEGLQPIYIQGLIGGFDEALKKDVIFECDNYFNSANGRQSKHQDPPHIQPSAMERRTGMDFVYRLRGSSLRHSRLRRIEFRLLIARRFGRYWRNWLRLPRPSRL